LAKQLLGLRLTPQRSIAFAPLASELRCRPLCSPFGLAATRVLHSVASSSSPSHSSLVPRNAAASPMLWAPRRSASGFAPLRYRTAEEILKDPFSSIDPNFDSWQRNNNAGVGKADPTGRFLVYSLLGVQRVFFLSAARLAVMKALYHLLASSDVMAAAKLEMDLKQVYVGTTLAVKWRGKPVFVRNRTQAEIDAARADDDALMKDPQVDEARVNKPQWLVVLAICTHLGCVPLPNLGQWKGFFCPCHGSHYDTSGRIRIGPAPLNLEVVEHVFPDANNIVIG